jgi:hypothetical protein
MFRPFYQKQKISHNGTHLFFAIRVRSNGMGCGHSSPIPHVDNSIPIKDTKSEKNVDNSVEVILTELLQLEQTNHPQCMTTNNPHLGQPIPHQIILQLQSTFDSDSQSVGMSVVSSLTSHSNSTAPSRRSVSPANIVPELKTPESLRAARSLFSTMKTLEILPDSPRD